MIKKIKLHSRERMIVAAAALAVLGYVFYSFWFSPYTERISQVKSNVQALQSEINKNQLLLNRAKDYAAKQVELDAQAQVLQRQLPTIEALPSVMANIQSVFAANGAELKSLSVDKPNRKKGLDAALDYRTVKVNFNASQATALAVLRALEKSSERTYTILDFSVNSEPKSSNLLGTMTVELYFAKTPLPGYGSQPS